MTLPLMPKATAIWLIENTSLTFAQISEFCGMHILEVQSIADGDIAVGIAGESPITSGQLSKEEIERCQKDSTAKLQINKNDFISFGLPKKKQTKYTPIARRQDKPDAVVWILKNYPEITDLQIIKLLGTTKTTIESVRNKEHWNTQNIRPRDPVLLGLCSQTALNSLIEEIEEKRKTKQNLNDKL